MATKDRQFKAKKGDGLLLLSLLEEGDEAEFALRTPQKAAIWHPVVQSPQQHEQGAQRKQATQVDLDPSSLVPIPMPPPPIYFIMRTSSGPAGHDAKDVKPPVSLPPSGSPYIESPPCTKKRCPGGVFSAVLPAPLQNVEFRFSGNIGGKSGFVGSCHIACKDKDAGTACGNGIGRK
jgi:hypothetical protein